MKERDTSMRESDDNLRAAAIVITTIIAVFGALLVSGKWLNDYPTRLQLPLLVIAGLVSLLGMLAVMAIAFKCVRLANQTQALGLPDGTVRAVIALSLILIFAVVTVYLFSDLSGPDVATCCKEIAQLPKSTSDITSTTSTTVTASGTVTGTAPGGTTTTGTTSTTATTSTTGPTPAGAAGATQVTKAAAAQDFAKQLLIMLGTLITSITSFYFASKTGPENSAPRPAPGPKPLIGRVEPKTSPKGGVTKLIGTNLLTVDRVLLRQKAQEVAAAKVSSSGTEVTFTVPQDAPVGPVEVVAKTQDGQEATVPGGMEIT